MNEPTISLCMIVKDEEELLPQCLESVKSIVDEIIMVDTGSSDQTMEIARRYGARVVQYEWQDNFAEARNQGLNLATGEWILWLDADEKMDKHQGKKLKSLLHKGISMAPSAVGVQFILCNYFENKIEQLPVLRMVRNLPEHRFKAVIHEQMQFFTPRVNSNPVVYQVDIQIHHYGYMRKRIHQKNKIERNIRLLHKASQQEPSNMSYHYYLAIEFYRCNRLSEALFHFNRLLQSSSHYPDVMIADTYRFKCKVLVLLGQHENLIRCSKEGIGTFKNYVDLYHFQAQGLYALGRTAEAIDVLQQVVQIDSMPENLNYTIGYGSYLSYYELGNLYEVLGDGQQANHCYNKAQQLYVNFLSTHPTTNEIVEKNSDFYHFLKNRQNKSTKGDTH